MEIKISDGNHPEETWKFTMSVDGEIMVLEVQDGKIQSTNELFLVSGAFMESWM